ncbi:MAG: hypothetical protein HQ463_10050 [Bacteroidetes bacterium]|nr:hypothetical protein [Bacteroidota bacterium]
MKKYIVIVFLLFSSIISAKEIPKRLYLFNLPDVLQQKISFSMLQPISTRKYFQMDIAFRQLFNYRKYYSPFGNQEPGIYYEKPFSSTQGFHLFASVGSKYFTKKSVELPKKKYWQPMLTFKYAEEKILFTYWRWYSNYNYIHYYNHGYSIGFEINNGFLKQKAKKVNDFYWGFGGRINRSDYKLYYGREQTPDYFSHRVYINSSFYSYSLYLNLGWKFGIAK